MTVFPFSHFNFYTGSYGIHQIFFQRAEIRIRFIRRLPLLSVFFTAEPVPPSIPAPKEGLLPLQKDPEAASYSSHRNDSYR